VTAECIETPLSEYPEMTLDDHMEFVINQLQSSLMTDEECIFPKKLDIAFVNYQIGPFGMQHGISS